MKVINGFNIGNTYYYITEFKGKYLVFSENKSNDTKQLNVSFNSAKEAEQWIKTVLRPAWEEWAYLNREADKTYLEPEDLLESRNRRNKRKKIRLNEIQLNNLIKKSVRKTLNEIRGWSAEPDDFCIVGGKLDPNKQYELIKISRPNGIYAMYVTEYKYFPDMLNDIRNFVNDEKMFIPLDDYYKEVKETMEEENCDEDYAEYLLSDIFEPIFDYDFAVYAPYGIANSEPMSGAEMQRKIDQTAKDNWMKH